MSRPPRPSIIGKHTEPLLALMRTGWATPPRSMPQAHPATDLRARRRSLLAAAFPDSLLVIPTGQLHTRANDTTYRFRPGTDFTWLVGAPQPGSVLVVDGGEPALYAAAPFDRDGVEWFADARGELVEGPRPALEDLAVRFGLDVRPLDQIDKLRGRDARVLRGLDVDLDGGFHEASELDAELATWLSEARLIKDAWEIDQLQDAVDITGRGFDDVVRAMPEVIAHGERRAEVVFGLRARAEGNDVGYGSICAVGEHACTLHYTDNDGPVAPGQLMLLDLGAENRELYTADITRTLPVSGRFTARQRELYTLVLQAQTAAIASVRPDARYDEPYHAAMRVLADGLEALGLVESADTVLDPDDRRHVRWTVHRAGHMLGLDVHDCAHARNESYAEGRLAAGHVLTIEPGLYFRPDDLLVPEELRGIGIRIEDDLLVTNDGHRVLSDAIPKEPDHIEDWMNPL